LGFAIEALPTLALSSLRERIVGRLKAAVYVEIFIARRVRVARVKAPPDKQTNGEAAQICPGEVTLHDGCDLVVAKNVAYTISKRGYQNLTCTALGPMLLKAAR
jgi:hypothetical protein